MKPFFLIAALLMALTGCATLAPAPAKAIQSGRANITTKNTLSQDSQSIVLSSGFSEMDCLQSFDACIKAVDDVFIESANQPKFALLAELYYAHAMHLKSSESCQNDRPPLNPYYANAPLSDAQKAEKQNASTTCHNAYLDSLYNSLRYSYAYLFYHSLSGNQAANPYRNGSAVIVSEAHIRTQDLYHVSIASLIDELYLQEQGSFKSSTNSTQSPTFKDGEWLLQSLQSAHTHPYTLKLYLEDSHHYRLTEDNIQALSDLSSVYDRRLPTLSVTSTRFGLGTGYVGSLEGRHKNTLRNHRNYTPDSPPKERIFPMKHLLFTAVITPEGERLDEVLSTRNFHAHLLNPYQSSDVKILGERYPLAANFSAGYAKWLKENQFDGVALVNMLDKNHTRLPELYMLEPYNPNKKVIIMLHGLASSPKTWVNLTNSLMADSVLRDHYQVWQVFYSTNLPMLENRYQIQSLIEAAFDSVDSQANDSASKDAVLILHSMGAVIGRMMLSDNDLNSALKDLQSYDKKTYAKLSKDALGTFEERLKLRPLAQVGTAVFISAPFRGTDYADRWFTRALRRTISLPVSLTQSIGNVLSESENDSNFIGGLYLQNGASQLSDKSDFMKLTQNVALSPKVRFHLIMANNTGNPADISSAISDKISDGIVPYSSSHLEGAESEIIIDGGHSIHENPKTILHLRHILHAHLEEVSSTNTK